MSSRTYRQILCLLFLAILVLHVSSTQETNKPGVLGTYCGNDFVLAWRECCGGRHPNCVAAAQASVQMNQGRRKRAMIKGGPFQPSWEAKNFFSRRNRRSVMTGATEECCNEQCSLQEIAEYPCFGLDDS